MTRFITFKIGDSDNFNEIIKQVKFVCYIEIESLRPFCVVNERFSSNKEIKEFIQQEEIDRNRKLPVLHKIKIINRLKKTKLLFGHHIDITEEGIVFSMIEHAYLSSLMSPDTITKNIPGAIEKFLHNINRTDLIVIPNFPL